jgi:hypothetical protein
MQVYPTFSCAIPHALGAAPHYRAHTSQEESAQSAMAKVQQKAVYDLSKKDLRNRTEVKFDNGLKARPIAVQRC